MTHLIKKYSTRRLYDTESSEYITLTDVKTMIIRGEDVEVVDAKTGEVLTRSVLFNIIFDEEQREMPLLSAEALKQIIRFYGQADQSMMSLYIERVLQNAFELQHKISENSLEYFSNNNLVSKFWLNFTKDQAVLLQKIFFPNLDD